MEELKIHGKYKKADGKKIMRLISEIKLKGMQLSKVVDENDMPVIVNIIAGRFLQYSVEKGIARGDKMMGEIEDRFLHGLMLAERDNTLTTVEEVWGSVEDEDFFDRIVIQNKDGRILYYGDRSEGIPEKFEDACVDRAGLNEDREVVITLAREK